MDTAGISKTLLDDYGNDQEFISVQHKLTGKGSSGTDILTNIENIQFQDKFMALSKEEFIYTDASGNEVRFIEGTEQADTIVGGNGNDELSGNGGNDTITGGVGGDMIRPGTGNDIIDGGENGQDPYTKELLSDVVMYDGNYADYTIKSEDVGGVLTIKGVCCRVFIH